VLKICLACLSALLCVCALSHDEKRSFKVLLPFAVTDVVAVDFLFPFHDAVFQLILLFVVVVVVIIFLFLLCVCMLISVLIRQSSMEERVCIVCHGWGNGPDRI
jgi:hypothetical protein